MIQIRKDFCRKYIYIFVYYTYTGGKRYAKNRMFDQHEKLEINCRTATKDNESKITK